MARYALRIASILIIVHSLIFFPTPVSRAEDRPTEAEVKQAREAADRFIKLLEETGDFSRVIDEMYAGDFIERYLREQTLDEESNLSSEITFVSGVKCKRDLLKQATLEDWRRLYIASNEFFYHIIIIGTNKSAEDILNDREPDDEIFDNLIPTKVITLFNNHPTLKGFLDIEEDDKRKSSDPAEEPQGDAPERKEQPQTDVSEKKEPSQGDVSVKKSEPKPIETPEEMRNVAETLQEALRLFLEAQGDQSSKLTVEAKMAIEKKIRAESMEPRIHVSDKECFGFPAGVRHMDILAPIMFMLIIGEIDGKQKIVWAEMGADD